MNKIIESINNEKNKASALYDFFNICFYNKYKFDTKIMNDFQTKLVDSLSKEDIVGYLNSEEEDSFLNHSNVFCRFVNAVLIKYPDLIYNINEKRFLLIVSICVEEGEHSHNNDFCYNFNFVAFNEMFPDFIMNLSDQWIRQDIPKYEKQEYNRNNKIFTHMVMCIEDHLSNKIFNENLSLDKHKTKKKITLENLEYFFGIFFFCTEYSVFNYMIDFIVNNYIFDIDTITDRTQLNFINAQGIIDFRERMTKMKDLDVLMPDNQSIYDVLNFKFSFGVEASEYKKLITPVNIGRDSLIKIQEYNMKLRSLMTGINAINDTEIDNIFDISDDFKVLLDITCAN